MVQCFSLTINQRTVLFSLAFQRSEPGNCFDLLQEQEAAAFSSHFLRARTRSAKQMTYSTE
jgi:hypothetical protein